MFKKEKSEGGKREAKISSVTPWFCSVEVSYYSIVFIRRVGFIDLVLNLSFIICNKVIGSHWKR